MEIVSKVILRHANLSTTQRYIGKVSDVEAMRWVGGHYVMGSFGDAGVFYEDGISYIPNPDEPSSVDAIGYMSGKWTVAPVPVPPTALLLGSGLIRLAWGRRRKWLEKLPRRQQQRPAPLRLCRLPTSGATV